MSSYTIGMNNSFEQCIADICGLELSSVPRGKYSVYGNKIAVVEGHGGISVYTPEQVSFAFGGGVLCVCGKNLTIKCLEKHYCVVSGNIVSMAVQNG